VLNKFDLVGTEAANDAFAYWQSELPAARVFPVSAKEHIYTRELMQEILRILPESPPYFPKDEVSDRTMRFFVAEIIREKIFLLYEREIPYSCEVVVEEYKEEEGLVRIAALILTERESQKRILIGHQGGMLKKVGTLARKDIEAFIGQQVFLSMFVKVEEDW
ncbi:MAG: GTPase Era, partial [Bacteroidota bacterium]